MTLENDSFDDDDDFDLDKVYDNAQATQKLQETQTAKPNPTTSNYKRNISSNDQSNSDKIYQIKGENAILRGQIEKLQIKQLEDKKRLNEEFNKLLKDKAEIIKSLNETVSKIKSENEFLVSENKNLYQTTSRKRKMRSVDRNSNETGSQQLDTSTQNTSTLSDSTQKIASNLPTIDITNDNTPEIKVVVMNQATFFQDEKTLFIEAITNYVIPGMPQSTLHYLENISSSFSFSSNDFQIVANENSFKSAILKYLINFQDKNRIDNLLTKFISILMEYILTTFEFHDDKYQLLPVPFLLSLINFSLNYRPKAINESFIGKMTEHVLLLLKNFQDIFKPEFDYLSLPNSNYMMNYVTIQSNKNNELLDYSFIEKPMHVKILEVFTAIFSMDIFTTLGKISSFHVFTFENSKANSIFWKTIPQQNFINSFLSRKTPIHFVYCTIEILINSINDDDRFAFANTRQKSITKPKLANEVTTQILEQVMQFLTSISPSQIHFNIYGLNRLIGSNNHSKLLEMVSIPSNELSSIPRTNSFDIYFNALKDDFKCYNKQEFYILNTKIKILDLFETFYSFLIMITLPLSCNLKLIKILCQLIGEEQEMVIRNSRSSNNSLRIELISKCVKLIHHLISQENIVKINELPNLTLREMIIVLLKISSNSMKNESISFVNNLRKSMNYNGPLFNGIQEMKELDKFGIFNSILSIDKLNDKERKKLIENRIQIEIDLYNGIEFNYSDETIDLARDIVGMSVTGDEADRLHDSINYIKDENNNSGDEDYNMFDND